MLKIKENPTLATLQKILREVRILRQEVSLFLPQEDLNDFAHPSKIIKSYQKALKKYPPSL